MLDFGHQQQLFPSDQFSRRRQVPLWGQEFLISGSLDLGIKRDFIPANNILFFQEEFEGLAIPNHLNGFTINLFEEKQLELFDGGIYES